MTDARPDSASGSSDLDAIYRERVAAELALADREIPGSDAVRSTGDPFACVLLVKGEPGPAEVGGGTAFGGADGDAARKALEVLGHDPARVFYALSRPLTDAEEGAVERRLRRIIEAVDPAWVLCVDRIAGADVARAHGAEEPSSGRELRLCGRRVLVLSGLEASLADDALKRTVWAELRAIDVRTDCGDSSA